jgi:hypothetical protein
VAHFTKPGGVFYITEAHPLAWSMSDDPPVRVRYPYWEHPKRLTFPVQGSYADLTASVNTPPVQHDDGRWYLPEDQEGELPFFYALRARRT